MKICDTYRRPVSDIRPPLVTGVLVVALGVGAGLLSGLFGIGGGALLVPGILALLATSQHSAHATSLAAIVVTASAAAVPFVLDGAVDLSAAVAVGAGALAGAFAGAGAMQRLSEARLRQGFALLVVLVALRLLVGGGEGQTAPAGTDPPAPAADGTRYAGLVALGLGAGGLAGLLGVGGGVIMVPALVLLFGADQHVAEGTSLLVIVPTALLGALRHARAGYTDWRLGLALGAGGVFGGPFGARLALGVDDGILARLFGVFLLIVATQLIVATRRARTRRPGA